MVAKYCRVQKNPFLRRLFEQEILKIENFFRISHKSEFSKIAIHSFYFYCTNLSEFLMDISIRQNSKADIRRIAIH